MVEENQLSLEELKNIPYDIINDKALTEQDYLFKLIIIGDTGKYLKLSKLFNFVGVGKSCLLARVMSNDFKLEH